jgi:Kef-type K+ transport system membrane component KefB
MSVVSMPVAPLSIDSQLVLFSQIGLLLGLAVVLGRLALRMGMPALVGELLAGVVLGPSVLGALAPAAERALFPADAAQVHLLDAVGQLGVLLLVAVTGMHLDMSMVRRRLRSTVAVSGSGLVVPLGLGIALGLLLPASVRGATTSAAAFALFLGVAMCVSAIPVIAKALLEMRLLHRDIGQLILGAAAIDDIIGWMLLSVATATATATVSARHVLLGFGAVALALLVAWVVGRPLVNGSYRLIARRVPEEQRPAAAIGTAVTLVFLFAAGSSLLRLEAVLGALFCGLLIGASSQVELGWFQPLRTLVMSVLAPLFFATVGLRMNLVALSRPSVLGVAVLVLAIAVVGKFAGVYLGARLVRLGHWSGLALAAGLNARGVIEVVVAFVGLRSGVLTPELFTTIVVVAIITSLMAPPTLRYATARIPVTHLERQREDALRF